MCSALISRSTSHRAAIGSRVWRLATDAAAAETTVHRSRVAALTSPLTNAPRGFDGKCLLYARAAAVEQHGVGRVLGPRTWAPRSVIQLTSRCSSCVVYVQLVAKGWWHGCCPREASLILLPMKTVSFTDRNAVHVLVRGVASAPRPDPIRIASAPRPDPIRVASAPRDQTPSV